MLRIFLSHFYKSFVRSSSVGKDTAVQIVLGFIVLGLAGYSIVVGFALEKIIIGSFKQQDAVAFLNRLLIYYFVCEFITRCLLQSLPALDARPYLHLPITRGKIANFILAKSLIHILNISVFLVFTPFALYTIGRQHGMSEAWLWLLSLWLISLINHFLVVLVKGSFAENASRIFTIIVICAVIGTADYFGWLQLSLISAKLFAAASQGFTPVGILFLVITFLYCIAYRSIITRLYSEWHTGHQGQSVHAANLAVLHNLGETGYWLKLELKLIFRNKRSRELFILHVVFWLLAFAMYSYIKNPGAYGIFLFFGLICSGFFTMNYGQFLFSWQGDHFDFMLTQPASVRRFIEAKYWLLASTTVLWFLFSIPFAFLGSQYLLVSLVASLYNIGVNIFVVMNMSMWGAKKIDLKHPGSLNLEGLGAAQWIMGIPLIASPYLFYLPLGLMGYPGLGLLFVGLSGFLGILFHKKLIEFTYQRLFNMRHVMASNFREG